MLRPIDASDTPALRELLDAAAPALRLYDADGALSAWTAAPSGHDHHLFGVWRHGVLTAAARVAPFPRPRLTHSARLELLTLPGADGDAVVAAAVAFVDAWTPVDRLQLDLPEDHPAIAAARGHGFEPEVLRAARHVDGASELGLGRLRPGFVPRPPGPPPPWPARAASLGGAMEVRAVTEADNDAVARLSVEATSVWGTLQTPSSSPAFYLARFRATPAGHRFVVITVDGEVAGIGGLHPTGVPDVVMFGMAVDLRWQGRGLGRRLQAWLLEESWRMGARRVELQVWEDNHRARALYTSGGFVEEGVQRCDGIRAGGYASSLNMAIALPAGMTSS